MLSFSRPLRTPVVGCWTAGLFMCCSACAIVPQTARSNPQTDGTVHAIYQEAATKPAKEIFGTKVVRKKYDSDIQQLNYQQSQINVTRTQKDSDLQQAGFGEPVGVPLGPINVGSQFSQIAGNNPCDVECYPPDCRWPAAGPSPNAPGMMACDVCNIPSPERYCDEYLCDGGDRDAPVHYDSVYRRGLDTEDTVLEFTDREGKERMKPSNRVCVYAPRFASVRTVSQSSEETMANEVGDVEHSVTSGGLHSRLKPAARVKREMTGRLAVRSRASGLEMDTVQGTVSQLRIPSVHDKLLNLYQALTFVRFGRIDDADTARLNYGLQAALVWTREDYPVIAAKTDMVLEGHFEQSTATITAIDEKTEAENLRIVKLADKKTAVPGDVIEFTIRYDNLGGREVFYVRIVDNLTPRLQYMDDSATSDRAGRLVLQDNAEGSQILIWELDEPLPGKSGGVVTFKTLVR